MLDDDDTPMRSHNLVWAAVVQLGGFWWGNILNRLKQLGILRSNALLESSIKIFPSSLSYGLGIRDSLIMQMAMSEKTNLPNSSSKYANLRNEAVEVSDPTTRTAKTRLQTRWPSSMVTG